MTIPHDRDGHEPWHEGEWSTPLQFLGFNLAFLRTAHERLSTLVDLQRAQLLACPGAMDEDFQRVEADLDLAYLKAETPRVLEESAEGLARLARTLGARGSGPEVSEGGYHHVS